MPLVSVIIPAYGHAECILQTLDSVLAQTFRDYEVIVVNDGSPDNTAAVLVPLVQEGKVRYFEQKNQGVAAARNFGISQAKGDYIALLDDDDLWPPDKLEWQVQKLEGDRNLGIVGGLWRAVGGPDSYSQTFDPKWESLQFTDFFKGNPFISPGQILIRRSVLEDVGGLDPQIWGVDDLDLVMRIAARANLLVEPRVSLFYRIHDGNASRNLTRMIANFRKVILKNLKYASESDRKRLNRESWLWLYSWTGVKGVQRLRTALKRMRLQELTIGFGELAPFAIPSLRFPGLGYQILADFINPTRRKS